MVDIPANTTVPVCIEQGSVYLYSINKLNNDGTTYAGSRFFIVLNTNPKTDQVLVMVTATTKIIEQERYVSSIGESKDTIVRITPKDFSPLSAESIVNCNNIYEISLVDLVGKIDAGGKVFFEKLPKDIVSSLVTGALISNQVSTEHKKLMV